MTSKVAPSRPNPRTLDLLWSTGEIHSVALLTLHLEELGVSAGALNIQETGLRLNGNEEVGFVRREIDEILDGRSIVVVPGFFGTHNGAAIRPLGRGGSDLSAVVLADGLDASRCELIKDVNGYFEQDPHSDAHAVHLRQLSYERALRMADEGCDLIQRLAAPGCASWCGPRMTVPHQASSAMAQEAERRLPRKRKGVVARPGFRGFVFFPAVLDVLGKYR